MLLRDLIHGHVHADLRERMLQELQDGGLVVRLEEHLTEPEPRNVFDQYIYRVVVLVHALLRNDVCENSFPSGVLGNEDLHADFLAPFSEILSPYRQTIFTNEQIVEGEHAHSPRLFARSVLLACTA